MFYTKWRFEQHPHTHPCAHTQIQVWLLAFWWSCQICVILGFAVHVQYGITNTCWRHVCRGASHLPNSLIYKKSPPNCCLRAKEVWKIGNFMYFWTKKWPKIQRRVLFCQICTLWGKKKNPEFLQNAHINSENQEEIHFWKICTLLRRKSLVWAWLKPVKWIDLGSKGGA